MKHPALQRYGWLKSRFTDEKALEQIQKVIKLTGLAEELGCTTAQLALAWCAHNPNVSTVITGASRPSQVEENMKSLQVLEQLTPDVIEKIEEILDNKPELPPDMR